MSIGIWVGVALLGGIGALGRFLLDTLISARAGGFPLGTFVVNITGSLLLGLLTGLAVEGQALLLLGTATLGSYTTFSTWMLETHRLAEDGEVTAATVNILLSLTVGVGGAALGRAIGAQI
ncbi:MAG TPA: fluoride efflux transporter CrcB [Solirubrobacteraceae bacterium]|nr:fluoride efflux transporter CrcB [Solirubrobacteraceae bacterium]